MMFKTFLTRARRGLASESGQSLVEFGVMLPLIVLVILALVDFGRALNMYLEANNAASYGARLAAADWNGAALPTQIHGALFGELKNGSGGSFGAQGAAQVCISFPNGGLTRRGNPVTVEVHDGFNWVPGGLIPGSITIAGRSTMRLEQDADFGAGCT